MEYVALLNDDSLSFHILAGCGDDFRQTGWWRDSFCEGG
jgi:hypothetical protein